MNLFKIFKKVKRKSSINKGDIFTLKGSNSTKIVVKKVEGDIIYYTYIGAYSTHKLNKQEFNICFLKEIK